MKKIVCLSVVFCQDERSKNISYKNIKVSIFAHNSKQSGVADRLRVVTYSLYCKIRMESSIIDTLGETNTDDIDKYYAVFYIGLFPRLIIYNFQEKSRKELKNNNYVGFSRG